MEKSLLGQIYELKEQIAILSNYLLDMSVANSGLLGSLEQITTITATVEALKIDVDAAEAAIVTLVSGQGTLITDVSNLTTSLTSVNAQVQLLNTGDMTILGQKTFDGTVLLNGEVDMTSTNNKTLGNTGGGITRIDGAATIGTLNGSTGLSGNVSINTGFTNNNTTIGNVSGGGQLFVASTTNLNGPVNATTTDNFIVGNTGGGITQINGTTQINSANVGNTNIGSAGGGTTTIAGTTNLTGVVNATSTNNFVVGNAAGGEILLNSKLIGIGTTGLGTSQYVSIASGGNDPGSYAVLGSDTLGAVYCRATDVRLNDFGTGNTNIGNAVGSVNVTGNFTRDLFQVKRWGISGGGGNSDYGSAGNRIGSTAYRASGTTSFTNVTTSGGAIASAWDGTNGFFTFPETGTYIINVMLFCNSGKIQSGVGAYAGGGGAFLDNTGFTYLFNDNTATNPPNSTTIYNATFTYCASGSSQTFYIGSAGTGSCVIYTGTAHSTFFITKVG